MQRPALRIPLMLFTIVCMVACAWLAFWPFETRENHTTSLERSAVAARASHGEIERSATTHTRRDKADTAITDPPRRANLHLRFLRGGEPAIGCAWRLSGTAVDRRYCFKEGVSSAEGISHLALPPGAYAVVLDPIAPWQSMDSLRMNFGPHLPVASSSGTREFEVWDADLDQWVEVAFAPGTLVLRTIDAVSFQPLPDTTLRVRCTSEQGAEAVFPSDAEGRVLLEGLEAGTWVVVPETPHHLLMSAATFEINELSPHHVADLHLLPTATLIVRLLGEDGHPLEIPHAFQLQVRGSNGEVCIPTRSTAEEEEWAYEVLFRSELLFAHLPADRYELRIVEQEELESEERGVRFQAVDCEAPLTIDAPVGMDTRADLRVRYRAYTQLKCAHPELASFVVRPLQWDPAIKRALTETWEIGALSGEWDFEGYLAPGAYDIVLKHTDGREWIERPQVEREPIERIFCPTWER